MANSTTTEAGLLTAIRSRLGGIRRAWRRLRDRSLHPRRRRRALESVRQAPVPGRVLTLCLGNVCRSPYVEASLRQAADRKGLALEVESGGFIGPGRPPPSEALEAARRRGVDTTRHLSRLVDGGLLSRSDLVLLVDPAHEKRLRREHSGTGWRTLILGDLDPLPVDSRTIPDPWGKGPEVFDQVFERLDRCMEVLLNEWTARGSS